MQTLAALIPNVGWNEMLVIGVILLLLFGRRLPEVGRSLGQGIVEFKKGLKDVTDDIKKDGDADAKRDAGRVAPAKFESVKAPHNPDMADSAHESAEHRVPEHTGPREPGAEA